VGVVVAHADHRAQHPIARGKRAQGRSHRGLGLGRLEIEGALRSDQPGHGRVDERLQTGLADDGQHVVDVGFRRADVPAGEFWQGGGRE
jgi:hypothetical protein